MLGLEIIEVEPGTVVEHEGEKLTVDDRNCVQINGIIYATAVTVAAIHRRNPARRAATNVGE